MVASTRDIGTYLRQRILPPGEARHGLVVGIEHYRDGRLDLRCARGDAQAMYKLMIDRDCGMFEEENVKLLLDEEATRENIWRALAALRRKAGGGDTVWIHYAGHAVPEGQDLYCLLLTLSLSIAAWHQLRRISPNITFWPHRTPS